MAATKKGKTESKAAPSATKPKASAGKSAETKTKVSSNGANPSASKAKPAAPKKAAPIKLTDKQRDLLKTIHEKGTAGYLPLNKNEERSVESLATKKLLKKGKKDKEKGFYSYMLTKTGEKEIAAPSSN